MGQTWFDIAAYEIENMKIKAAISLADDNDAVEVLFDLRKVEWTNAASAKDYYEFKISSYKESQGWSDNATGSIKLIRRKPGFDAGKATTLEDDYSWKRMRPEKLYEMFSSIGLNYGPTFNGLKDIKVRPGLARALTDLNPTAQLNIVGESRYTIHPAVIDTCLQISLAGQQGNLEKPYLPVFAERITIFPNTHLQAESQLMAVKPGTVEAKSEIIGLRSLLVNSQLFNSDGSCLMDIQNFRCASLENAIMEAPAEAPRYPYSRSVWKPDFTALNQQHLGQLYNILHEEPNAEKWVKLLERLTVLWMVQVCAEYPELLEPRKEGNNITMFKRAVMNYARKADVQIRGMSIEGRKQEILSIAKQLEDAGCMDAQFGMKIYDYWPQILKEERLTIDVLREDDLWTRFYVESLCHRGANRQLEKAIDLVAHKQPGMKILEVGAGTGGATAVILPVLKGNGQFRRYESYTFTDLSHGFFPAAKERFQEHRGVDYKLFDCSTDPTTQGYEAHSFDLVIASNVLHATPSLVETLKNVRRLLKPGGALLFLETTREFLFNLWAVGSLTGWWYGHEDGRMPIGAAASLSKWNDSLKLSGFSGLDLIFDDYPGELATNTVILSYAVEPVPKLLAAPRKSVTDDILIITRDENTPVAHALSNLAANEGHAVKIATLSAAPEPTLGTRVYLLADLERPLLATVTDAEFSALKKLISKAKSLHWITTGAFHKSSVPANAMSVGFTRTMREENPQLAVHLLNLDDGNISAQAIWEHSTEVKDVNAEGIDWEKSVSEGVVYVERVVPDDELVVKKVEKPEMEMVEWGSKKPLKMAIETVGLFDTIHFKDDDIYVLPLGEEEVEIKVEAVGMNFKVCFSGSVMRDNAN